MIWKRAAENMNRGVVDSTGPEYQNLRNEAYELGNKLICSEFASFAYKEKWEAIDLLQKKAIKTIVSLNRSYDEDSFHHQNSSSYDLLEEIEERERKQQGNAVSLENEKEGRKTGRSQQRASTAAALTTNNRKGVKSQPPPSSSLSSSSSAAIASPSSLLMYHYQQKNKQSQKKNKQQQQHQSQQRSSTVEDQRQRQQQLLLFDEHYYDYNIEEELEKLKTRFDPSDFQQFDQHRVGGPAGAGAAVTREEFSSSSSPSPSIGSNKQRQQEQQLQQLLLQNRKSRILH
jgi:hypothetical protein